MLILEGGKCRLAVASEDHDPAGGPDLVFGPLLILKERVFFLYIRQCMLYFPMVLLERVISLFLAQSHQFVFALAKYLLFRRDILLLLFFFSCLVRQLDHFLCRIVFLFIRSSHWNTSGMFSSANDSPWKIILCMFELREISVILPAFEQNFHLLPCTGKGSVPSQLRRPRETFK